MNVADCAVDDERSETRDDGAGDTPARSRASTSARTGSTDTLMRTNGERALELDF
jgi:hypothetical protein